MSTVSEPPSGASPVCSGELIVDLDDSDADIILRSCDHHEFRVAKLYVTKVSPVLSQLIQSASSSHTANATSSLPLVHLSDGGATLSSLLTFILPMLPVLPSSLERTMILLSAAQKYQMDAILTRIRGMVALQDPPFIRPETAFHVYSLARMHGLQQEALRAARTTLTFQFNIEDLEDELDAIPGIFLHELWKYYQSVQTHLMSDLATFKTTNMHVLTSPPCGPVTSHGKPVWLDSYIDSIAASPALFDITEFHLCLSRHVRDRCCWCGNIPSKIVRAFWMDLTNAVHSCMAKVSCRSYARLYLANNMVISIGRVGYLALGRSSNHYESSLPNKSLTNLIA